MTFIEAAADILDREGKPLRAREIAEKAVALGILSHVGKTPVQTMSAQLSAAVLKGTGPFSRVRPGVFALTKWQGKPPGPKREAPSKPVPSKPESVAASKREAAAPLPKAGFSDAPRETTLISDADKRPRTADHIPVRPADTGEDKVPADAGESASQKRRKRRRKKSSKLPVSPTSSGEVAPSTVPEPSFEVRTESGPENATSAAVPPLHAHLKPEESRRPAIKEPHAHNATRDKPKASTGAFDEIADVVEKILRRASRPMPPEMLLEELGIAVPDGRILLDALLTSDALERERGGRRPRFVKHKSGYGLLEREVSTEITALENQAADIKRRLAQLAERQVLKKLRALPVHGFVRTMIVYLERSGFGAVKPVRISGLDGIHLSVQDRRRNGTFRTAVVLRRDVHDHLLTERAVMDVRGAMHHFDAMGGIIFTTGQTTEKASAEGRIANLPPVAVVDGETLASEMVRLGIGVKERAVRLPTYDEVFFAKIES